MRAARHDQHGGPEVLGVVDVDDPEPGRADVVVRVEACALHRLDVAQRAGWPALDGVAPPHVPRMDVAGTVVAVGDAVRGVTAGGAPGVIGEIPLRPAAT